MASVARVRYEVDDGVAIVSLNEPAKLNALSAALCAELREAVARAGEDRSVRALLLTGEGKAFCAGADLSAMAGHEPGGKSLGERTADAMRVESNPLILELRALPVPVLSALNGAAVGGGVGLALAADVVIAARSAYFYLPSMPRLGLLPDLGASWFLPAQIGRARYTALTLLGDRLPAEQAAQWGIVWSCVDDSVLREEAMKLARRLAATPSHAAVETRRALDSARTQDLRGQLAYEADRQHALIDRPTFGEGVSAFMHRRDPVFPSR
jgi:2-(1,2-epoxy-1,2-dihydrophenyl)acetyl-CoA isomerase